MALNKADPVYYKLMIEKLIKQAREAGLEVSKDTYGIRFSDNKTGEITIARVN